MKIVDYVRRYPGAAVGWFFLALAIIASWAVIVEWLVLEST